MTETWTHQFNSEADFLDFLKMKRELEELLAKVKYLEKAVDDYANDIVKKNETIGELRRASSPIECEAGKFLKRAAFGGYIISSGQCTQMEISFAGAENRMYVNPDGLGFILRPSGAQLPKNPKS